MYQISLRPSVYLGTWGEGGGREGAAFLDQSTKGTLEAQHPSVEA